MLENILAISAGAVVGALARYTITHHSSELTHHSGFPFGTLAVNVIGCFAVGWILAANDGPQDRWRLLAATGFCGAFTTFSAFAYESMAYWRQGAVFVFAVNVLANNVLSLLAVVAGMHLRSGR
jgi:fluoride exporter